MSGTKILVVVLIVFAVAFVLLTVTGSRTNDSVKTTGDPSKDAQSFNPKAYSLTDSFGSVLGNFGPKLDPKQMQPSVVSFNLQTKPKYVINVAADEGDQFRNAKFLMRPASGSPCAHILYVALNPPSQVSSSLKNQDSNSNTSSNKYQVSMAVLAGGGTITVERAKSSAGSCLVTLE